jgi:outer membrane protein OmpA-like peptidoglycan-associated protein
MKKIISLLMIMVIFSTIATMAQYEHKWHLAASAGMAIPQTTYKTVPGHAKNGLFTGLTLDRFFKCGEFGIGTDLRFITNQVDKNVYELTFTNGAIHAPAAFNVSTSFQHTGFALGPVYRKALSSRVELNATIKGGVLYSSYPEFKTFLEWGAVGGPHPNITMHEWTTSSSTDEVQWMAQGALSLHYKITSRFKLFAKGDYMQTIGDKFFGNNNTQYRRHTRTVNNPLTASSFISGWVGGVTPYLGYYNAGPNFIVQEKTPIKTINLSAGINFGFGTCKTKATRIKASKNVMVYVKDRLTGLSLGQVRVTIKANDGTVMATGFTNENGQYTTQLKEGEYTVEGIKNNIASTTDHIDRTEFALTADILSELVHDDPRFTLTGETVDINSGVPIANIATTLTNMSNAEAYNQTSGSTGNFQYQLQANTDYSLVASQRGIFSNVETITTKGLSRSQTLYVKLKMGVKDLSLGTSLTVENIYYDLDKATIRSDAGAALNNLVRVLRLNPDLKIELSAHTDSRGDDAYNMLLSQKRAEAVVTYLVSKGINASRLTAMGYGETRPVNHCTNGVNCTEAEYQKNRRTEIKVLSN